VKAFLWSCIGLALIGACVVGEEFASGYCVGNGGRWVKGVLADHCEAVPTKTIRLRKTEEPDAWNYESVEPQSAPTETLL
jgi:hypothetical protein